MSVYQPNLGKGRGKSPFWHYDFIVNGQRHRGSTEKEGKREARKVEEEKRREFERPSAKTEPITFSALADLYLKNHASGTRSADFYKFTVAALKEYFGEREVRSITAQDCDTFMAARRIGVKASAYNASVTVLKHMLRMAERYNFLPKGENPAADLKRQKVRPRDRYATKAEAQTLIDSCFDWLKPIVLTALHTGGRRGEVLGLTWQDVDFEGGRITFLDTKNGDVRKVPMSTLLRSTLKALPNRLKGGPVFVRGGAAVTKHMLRDGFDAAVVKAAMPGFHFHDLRHTWATHLAADGVPLRELMNLGGWRQISMVQRYAAVTPESQGRAVQALDRIFSANPTTAPPQKATEGSSLNSLKTPEVLDAIGGAEDRT